MNDTLTGLNIGLDDFGHVIGIVLFSLLIDLVTFTDCCTVLFITHRSDSITNQISCLDNIVDGMVKQNILQKFLITQNVMQYVGTKFFKGSVVWSEDRQWSIVQIFA